MRIIKNRSICNSHGTQTTRRSSLVHKKAAVIYGIPRTSCRIRFIHLLMALLMVIRWLKRVLLQTKALFFPPFWYSGGMGTLFWEQSRGFFFFFLRAASHIVEEKGHPNEFEF
ncbi:hypothetical protein CEXT_55151 [Caerostris extrusa]|uniref:Uncharacterized protein n=1 Tax=Caerostris extrusa TaxID=172846 RepID=A0AAV4WRS4_CAEEX|nr:hypothetical protein CEXT_55151 [Caerostris extrusa]